MKLIIVCDGGLGNRLNCLLTGLTILYELKVHTSALVWPENLNCPMNYEILFGTQTFGIGDILTSFNSFLKSDDTEIFSHLPDIYGHSPWNTIYNPLALTRIRNAAKVSRDVIISTDLIPIWCSPLRPLHAASKELASTLEREHGYLFDAFIAGNPDAKFAYHLRGTDFPNRVSEGLKAVRYFSSNKIAVNRTVLITDDRVFSNFFAYMWSDLILSNQENKNIRNGLITVSESRSRASMNTSLRDLMILINLRIVRTGNSTFLDLAIRLSSAVNKEAPSIVDWLRDKKRHLYYWALQVKRFIHAF